MPNSKVLHLCFTATTSEADGKAEFIRRYHQEPKEVYIFMRVLWVGPVPGLDTGGDKTSDVVTPVLAVF